MVLLFMFMLLLLLFSCTRMGVRVALKVATATTTAHCRASKREREREHSSAVNHSRVKHRADLPANSDRIASDADFSVWNGKRMRFPRDAMR